MVISFYQNTTINVQSKEDQKEVENALNIGKKTTNLLYWLTDKRALEWTQLHKKKSKEGETFS